MSIVTTSTARTARLFWSGDSAVTVTDEVLAQLQPKQTADDALPEAEPANKPVVPKPLKPQFVRASMCKVEASATAFDCKALSYLQYQELEALPADDQIARVVNLCLVSIDGDANRAADFLAAPPADLWVPLYRACAALTWGNLLG